MATAINIVCDGNSLTAGFGATGYQIASFVFGSSYTVGSYPSQLQAMVGANVATVTNVATSGYTTTQLISRAATLVDPLYNASATMNLLFVMEIGNDILLGNGTPTQCYTNFVNYCLARKAAGWKVAIMTLPSRNGAVTATGTLGTQFDSVTRPFVNSLLRTNWSSYSDFLIDLASDVRFSTYTNTTYYTSDQVHYVDAGYSVIATYACNVVSALYYGNVQLTLKQLLGQLYSPSQSNTTTFASVYYSGTSFIADVTLLGLSSNLSIIDYQVLNGSTDITASFTKTSKTQLTYAGAVVPSGSKLIFYRKTPMNFSEVTFLSTTTASGLTNALTKLLLRVQELETKQSQLQAQLSAGGIALAPLPIISHVFDSSWIGDVSNTTTRSDIYNAFASLPSSLATLNSPVFSGNPTAPTVATTDNSVSIATTALVTNKVNALGAVVVAQYAPLASPTFTGTPVAPTVATTDSSTNLSTTAWVKKWANASAGMRIGGVAIAGNNQVVTPAASGQVIINVSAFGFSGYFAAIVSNGDSGVAKNYVFSVDSTNTSATQLAFYIWNATTNAAVTTATRVAWFYYGSYALAA